MGRYIRDNGYQEHRDLHALQSIKMLSYYQICNFFLILKLYWLQTDRLLGRGVPVSQKRQLVCITGSLKNVGR